MICSENNRKILLEVLKSRRIDVDSSADVTLVQRGDSFPVPVKGINLIKAQDELRHKMGEGSH